MTEHENSDQQTIRPRAGNPRAVQLTDARALRAVAHPLRLALVGLLRREGPLTATQAARRLDDTPQRCTFHLGQLAKYGLVEDAGGGRGRERPWRATASFTSWPNVADGPELSAAAQMLTSVVAARYYELIMGWIESKPDESREWQEAAQFGDSMLYLTAEELAELGRAIWELADRYAARTGDKDLRPAGSRLVALLHLAFPWPGQPGGTE